jgi:hypothetical protein
LDWAATASRFELFIKPRETGREPRL